jgi:hypothetical protein
MCNFFFSYARQKRENPHLQVTAGAWEGSERFVHPVSPVFGILPARGGMIIAKTNLRN